MATGRLPSKQATPETGVASPQGVEWTRMVGPSNTLGSLWIPLAITPMGDGVGWVGFCYGVFLSLGWLDMRWGLKEVHCDKRYGSGVKLNGVWYWRGMSLGKVDSGRVLYEVGWVGCASSWG
jgi:hypothetical protein